MPLTRPEISKRWRELYPELSKQVNRNNYNKNKEKAFARVARSRLFKSECKRLMKICIN